MWRRARKRVLKMIKTLKRKPLLTPAKEKPAKETKKEKNKLPPDTYADIIEPMDIEIDETRKFVISVKRGGELGLPMCDIRQYQTTDLYTGFTKKGVNFPIELIADLVELLQVAYSECVEKELL